MPPSWFYFNVGSCVGLLGLPYKVLWVVTQRTDASCLALEGQESKVPPEGSEGEPSQAPLLGVRTAGFTLTWRCPRKVSVYKLPFLQGTCGHRPAALGPTLEPPLNGVASVPVRSRSKALGLRVQHMDLDGSTGPPIIAANYILSSFTYSADQIQPTQPYRARDQVVPSPPSPDPPPEAMQMLIPAATIPVASGSSVAWGSSRQRASRVGILAHPEFDASEDRDQASCVRNLY